MAELAAALCGWGSSHTGRSAVKQGTPGFAVRDPVRGMVLPHSGWIVPPQFDLSGNALTGTPKGVAPRGFQVPKGVSPRGFQVPSRR